MASSNRHWPSLFKSKPLQWQHEVNSSVISNGCHRSSSYTSEERTPEPKPRWNPRPEQIRILESIFDSGMVNPPRDEIRKIRAQLQEYGQVGDANVFYWFQNRKSRSKHKLRNSSKQQRHQTPPATTTATTTVAPSSSSSSSENKSSPSRGLSKSCTTNVFTLGHSNMDASNPATFSLSPPPYFPVTQEGILTEPFLFQGSGFLLPEGFGGGAGIVQYGGESVGPCGTFMPGEMMNHGSSDGGGVSASKKVKTMATTTTGAATLATYSSVSPPSSSSCASVSPQTATVPFLSSISTHHQLHAARTTTNVFINDVAFEVVAEEPFNVRATFGDEAVLVNASGQAVLTDEWGVTLHPLHPAAFYYLIW